MWRAIRPDGCQVQLSTVWAPGAKVAVRPIWAVRTAAEWRPSASLAQLKIHVQPHSVTSVWILSLPARSDWLRTLNTHSLPVSLCLVICVCVCVSVSQPPAVSPPTLHHCYSAGPLNTLKWVFFFFPTASPPNLLHTPSRIKTHTHTPTPSLPSPGLALHYTDTERKWHRKQSSLKPKQHLFIFIQLTNGFSVVSMIDHGFILSSPPFLNLLTCCFACAHTLYIDLILYFNGKPLSVKFIVNFMRIVWKMLCRMTIFSHNTRTCQI